MCNLCSIDYVEEIYQTYLTSTKDELKDAIKELKEMTPAPMNSMLKNKQPQAEAIKKREDRSKMGAKDVPPTTPGILQTSV